MSTTDNPLWIVELACGHFAGEKFVEPRGEFYCAKHATIEQVKRVRPVWRVKCLNCKFGRNSGTSPFLSEVAMARHQKNCPTHKLELWQADKLVTVKVPKVLLSELPSLPPF